MAWTFKATMTASNGLAAVKTNYQHKISLTLGDSTVDVEAASGQKVVPIASTTGFTAGDYVILDAGNANEEWGQIDTVSAGVSITLLANLTNTHAVSVVVSNADQHIVDNTQSAGEDIRVTPVGDTSSTLDHWIEIWDGTDHELWVKIPTIGSSSSTDVDVHYGGGAVATTSDISTTGAYGSDFSQYWGTTQVSVNGDAQRAPQGMVAIGTDLYATFDEASTGPWSLAKSTDGGTTWTELDTWSGAAGARFPALTTDGTDKLYVMSEGGLFRIYTSLGDDAPTTSTENGGSDPAILWTGGSNLVHAYTTGSTINVRTFDGATWSSAQAVDTLGGPPEPEDLKLIVAGNGDVLLMAESENVGLGASSIVQYRSLAVDKGVGNSWEAQTTIIAVDGDTDNEGGDYALLSDGTLEFYWPQSVTDGTYEDNALRKVTSSNHGVDWDTPVTVDDGMHFRSPAIATLSDDTVVVAIGRFLDHARVAGFASIMHPSDPLLSADGWSVMQNSPNPGGMALIFRDTDGSTVARVYGSYETNGVRGYFQNSFTFSDHALYTRMKTEATGVESHLLIRATDAENNMILFARPSMNLYEQAGGGFSPSIDSAAVTYAVSTWYKMEVAAEGVNYAVTQDGVEVLSGFDTDDPASHTSGTFALGTGNDLDEKPSEFDWVFVRVYDGTDTTNSIGLPEAESEASLPAVAGGSVPRRYLALKSGTLRA